MDGFTLTGNISVLSDGVVRTLNQLHESIEMIGDFKSGPFSHLFKIHENVVLVNSKFNVKVSVLQIFSVDHKGHVWAF